MFWSQLVINIKVSKPLLVLHITPSSTHQKFTLFEGIQPFVLTLLFLYDEDQQQGKFNDNMVPFSFFISLNTLISSPCIFRDVRKQ